MIRVLLSIIYIYIGKIRILFYGSGIFKKHHFNVKIISVGNLSMGGTGKTPLVQYLSGKIAGKIAVIERGYKSRIGKEIYIACKGKDKVSVDLIGDEAALIFDDLVPGSFLVVSKDKTQGVKKVLDIYDGIETVIVDDAFQHLKLYRNVDIVLMEYKNIFKDSVFPKGRLREPYSALKRSGLIVITKSNEISNDEKLSIKKKIWNYSPAAEVFFCSTVLKFSEKISKCKILPVSGICNSGHFHDMLKQNDLTFDKYIAYSDHYGYSGKDIEYMIKTKKITGADKIIVTGKDWVKIRDIIPDSYKCDFTEVWYEHEFDDEGGFLSCLQKL